MIEADNAVERRGRAGEKTAQMASMAWKFSQSDNSPCGGKMDFELMHRTTGPTGEQR